MEGQLAENKKLQDYPMAVSIPKNYNSNNTYGLLVSMINAKSKNQFPREPFQEILDTYGIIWVGFDPYNGVFVPFQRNHIQQPLKGHAIISPEIFERSLCLLEGED
jgi:hypothetical protein